MVDNIEIQKVWQDDEIYQLKVKCSSSVVTATTKIYVCDALIDDLIHQINQFLNGHVEKSCWSNGTRGNDSTECVSFGFIKKDKLGHILIDVFMELEDGGGFDRHNCCFYVNTETGFLTSFCERLIRLKQGDLGFQLALNDVDI